MELSNADDKEDEFLTIKAACSRLGVSPNTLRSWGAAGKVTEYRHPMNNYRLYLKVDIEELRDRLMHPQPIKTGSGIKNRGEHQNRES